MLAMPTGRPAPVSERKIGEPGSIRQGAVKTTKREGHMKDKLQCWIAYRMPRWLVRWCSVRLGAHATTGQWSSQVVPELTFMDALKRW